MFMSNKIGGNDKVLLSIGCRHIECMVANGSSSYLGKRPYP